MSFEALTDSYEQAVVKDSTQLPDHQVSKMKSVCKKHVHNAKKKMSAISMIILCLTQIISRS